MFCFVFIFLTALFSSLQICFSHVICNLPSVFCFTFQRLCSVVIVGAAVFSALSDFVLKTFIMHTRICLHSSVQVLVSSFIEYVSLLFEHNNSLFYGPDFLS